MTSRPDVAPAPARAATSAAPGAALPAVVIECVSPAVDGGRYAVKRVVGDELRIGADIFKDGHDLLSARVLYRGPGDDTWHSSPLTFVYDDDRWYGSVPLDRVGAWWFTIEAWIDRFGTWRAEVEKKAGAGQEVGSELLEGAEMVHQASRHARGTDRQALDAGAAALIDETAGQEARVAAALAPELLELMHRYGPHTGATVAGREYPVRVDPPDAAFAAWYEMFPRSTAAAPGRHGTFRDAAAALPRIADLGFDVVYLPPIHPIGRTHRKGPNNVLEAGPDDPGSPWAIGNEHGGHTAVAPELGTLDDFRAFVAEANRLGLEVALDYALQCSPDHPWVTEHPEWFFVRPDGTIKYAENPPKKYEDIFPLNFWCDDREGLWNACRDIFLFWIAAGVRTFRVDNPHTKPFSFWEWVIADVHRRHPDTVFLSEAFTRPKRMKSLAKLGFTQSYTYFTWRNTAAELRDYVTELARGPAAEYFRGNFFTNTPDILHEFLQAGGPPAFRIRLLLAATLVPLYGIYSGFELSENIPLREGSEEYLDSEKYQIRQRDWAAPGNLDADIRRINAIRRQNRAFQLYRNISFPECGNDRVLFYLRCAWQNDILCVVTMDPLEPQDAELRLPLDQLGIGADETFEVEDLLSGERRVWCGPVQSVRIDPVERAGYLFRVVRTSAAGAGA